MNATQGIEAKSSGYANSPANVPDTAIAKIEQRAINLRAFQEKYDVMLNFVEFMASLNMVGIKNLRQKKKMDELKSLVAETRDRLDLCEPHKTPFDGHSTSGKAGSRG